MNLFETMYALFAGKSALECKRRQQLQMAADAAQINAAVTVLQLAHRLRDLDRYQQEHDLKQIGL